MNGTGAEKEHKAENVSEKGTNITRLCFHPVTAMLRKYSSPFSGKQQCRCAHLTVRARRVRAEFRRPYSAPPGAGRVTTEEAGDKRRIRL
ncbi:hypothetical protein AAFF_G00030220 [Aldrovandia affinis]|uniref:Uncharacterized protein n=1 Tax=Aldrovandia affinis TaxID=143900 RepID=A0AAD7S680_9TELE|nr:hypothetical protein AAFF_G00030220 [Aldrovandia affinis]